MPVSTRRVLLTIAVCSFSALMIIAVYIWTRSHLISTQESTISRLSEKVNVLSQLMQLKQKMHIEREESVNFIACSRSSTCTEKLLEARSRTDREFSALRSYLSHISDEDFSNYAQDEFSKILFEISSARNLVSRIQQHESILLPDDIEVNLSFQIASAVERLSRLSIVISKHMEQGHILDSRIGTFLNRALLASNIIASENLVASGCLSVNGKCRFDIMSPLLKKYLNHFLQLNDVSNAFPDEYNSMNLQRIQSVMSDRVEFVLNLASNSSGPDSYIFRSQIASSAPSVNIKSALDLESFFLALASSKLDQARSSILRDKYINFITMVLIGCLQLIIIYISLRVIPQSIRAVNQRLLAVRSGETTSLVADSEYKSRRCDDLEYTSQLVDLVDNDLQKRHQFLQNQQIKEQELRTLVGADPLTGLDNRFNLELRGNAILAEAKRHGFEVCFLGLDVDFFKKVNDTYGHIAGDKVLRCLGAILKSSLRKEDVVGRIGGEEFVALVGYCPLAQGIEKADALRMQIASTPIEIGSDLPPLFVTVSIGVTSTSRRGHDWIELSAAADRALYGAKSNGRNCVVAD